jgi:hypothetical protein
MGVWGVCPPTEGRGGTPPPPPPTQGAGVKPLYPVLTRLRSAIWSNLKHTRAVVTAAQFAFASMSKNMKRWTATAQCAEKKAFCTSLCPLRTFNYCKAANRSLLTLSTRALPNILSVVFAAFIHFIARDRIPIALT